MNEEERDRIARLQGLLSEVRGRDSNAEIDALVQIARASEEIDFGLANTHFDLAAKVIRRTGIGKDRLPGLLGGRALALRRLKRFPEALKVYEEAVAAAREHAGAEEVAHLTGRQAPVLQELERTEEARKVAEQARDMYRALGDAGLAGLAEQEGMLGLLALDDDDEDAAYAAHRRAAEFAERSGEPAAIAIWARNLANLQSRRRRYREAAEWYRKALDAAVRSENVRRVGDCALAWWRSCTAAHRHSDAAEVLLGASRHLRDANRRANFLDRALSSWARAADWARVEVVAPDLLKVFREELRAAPEHVQRVERLLEQARSGGGP